MEITDGYMREKLQIPLQLGEKRTMKKKNFRAALVSRDQMRSFFTCTRVFEGDIRKVRLKLKWDEAVRKG